MQILSTIDSYQGLLVIGDPHLEGRIPGFRKDDYPKTILEKLRWSLKYASENKLLPLILGDLFHLPRSNPNWLLVEVMRIFNQEVFGIYGNHDIHENQLTPDDSISVLAESGSIKLLDTDLLLKTKINGTSVLIGGTPWGKRLPQVSDELLEEIRDHFVVWLTHHDIIIPGYEEQGYIRPKELPGINLVINGHIHRSLDKVKKGSTLWLTPGNISRRARNDAGKVHTPSILRIDIQKYNWNYYPVQLPHLPYDQVFHEAILDTESEEYGSAFIAGLAELQARRTETGEGLKFFLEKNLKQFDSEVAEEIRKLAEEVICHE